MRFINAKKHTILILNTYIKIDLGLIHAYIRLLSSRVRPEYRLTELFILFLILPTLQMSILPYKG